MLTRNEAYGVKLDISKEVLKRTTQCSHNYACLETGQCPCTVMFVSEETLILETHCSKKCPYIKQFAFGYLCNCPVHRELEKRSREK